jgi:hypothetical protein
MPTHRGPIARAHDVRTVARPSGDLGHGFRAERVQRRARGQQHGGAGPVGPLVFPIAEDGLAPVLRQGETGGAPVLASHAHGAVGPGDLAPLPRGDIPCAEPSARQEQEHGALAHADGGGEIAAGQHTFHRLGRAIPGPGR